MRIIVPKRFRADQDRVTFRAQPLSMPAGRGAGDPSSFFLRSSQTPIQAHAAFGNHERNAGSGPFVECLVEPRAFLGQYAGANFNPGVLEDFQSTAAMPRV